MNRRHFLGLALSAATMPALAKKQSYRPRILSFYHRHTGEKVKVAYRIGNFYQRDALQALNNFMRDFRTDDVTMVDPKLFDLLYELNGRLGHPRGPIEILSAYRSPRTNAILRSTSRRVARNSLHIQGKAVDIRLPGISARWVRDSAISLNRGGVGFYPRSNFVHVDTGKVRRWVA
ncbi:YcbK family protein [Candidatus Thiosymbion oneisti]|uniref:YcbK family protein n=1 Tax=Candidatus Thiosymbion oneisti TaxID=589554 RepID=UPI000B0150E7|nr:YcbK family protein [Candidatus Thiosymbion oneisti]